MEKKEYDKVIFGLVGKDISYSFSRGYFSEKFELLGLNNHDYLNFDMQLLDELPEFIKKHQSFLKGMNVTIPYKEEVFAYVDKIHPKAKKIGAINTIRITKKGKLKGYNTDEYGFRHSIKPLLKSHHKKALVLGTGGASKAVAYALDKLHISFKFVSRTPELDDFFYDELTADVLKEYSILINCTPLGTYPNVEVCPNIPYEHLTDKHLLYDLIYNPKETLFLQKGKAQGATIKNGLEMLELQAEKAWKIWNK